MKIPTLLKLTKEERGALDKLGGPIKGFRTILNFFLENYSLFQEQEQNKKHAMARLNRDKK